MPEPIAVWNPARDVWETQTMGLFCAHWDAFSGTWPASGMTRGGQAYALPTLAPPTAEPGSSCSPLLPTPLVKNNENQPGPGYGPNLGAALAELR